MLFAISVVGAANPGCFAYYSPFWARPSGARLGQPALPLGPPESCRLCLINPPTLSRRCLSRIPHRTPTNPGPPAPPSPWPTPRNPLITQLSHQPTPAALVPGYPGSRLSWDRNPPPPEAPARQHVPEAVGRPIGDLSHLVIHCQASPESRHLL